MADTGKLKSADHYDRKIHCPRCRARLMDVAEYGLDYRAVVTEDDRRKGFGLIVKCGRCKATVGITMVHRFISIPVLGSRGA